LVLANGRIFLTLIIGDVRDVLEQIDAIVDAWFLDGFAPARNPDMWQPEVLAAVARLSRSGGTCATYTVAGAVRSALETAGFAIEKHKGFGRKREMLRGVLVGAPRAPWRAPWFARPSRPHADRRAMVVGAGLAGTAAAASLARRGWSVAIVDQHATVAAEASGNPQGVLYARPSPHGTVLSELVTSGLQHTCRLFPELGLEDGTDFARCGVLQLAYDADEEARQEKLVSLGWPRPRRNDSIVWAAQS